MKKVFVKNVILVTILLTLITNSWMFIPLRTKKFPHKETSSKNKLMFVYVIDSFVKKQMELPNDEERQREDIYMRLARESL